MTWDEFSDARLLMAEERVGTRVRSAQREELAQEQSTADILRQRGMVSDGPR